MMAQEQVYRILLVEDDRKLAELLSEELQRFGYLVRIAVDFNNIRAEFLTAHSDLVLLDINLPRFDGFYWCRQIRAVSQVPIIFISARSSDFDQVRALENGGDDFIIKPFNMELALAKVRSVIRRAYGEYAPSRDPEILSVGELELNKNDNRVAYSAHTVELTPKEFRLLWRLAERAGEIVSREELLEALWDDVDFVDDNTLTVNVTRVRRRLADLGLPELVETKRGQGYRLSVPPLQ